MAIKRNCLRFIGVSKRGLPSDIISRFDRPGKTGPTFDSWQKPEIRR
jgi:hypothetical protein